MVFTKTADLTTVDDLADNAREWYETAGMWALLIAVLFFALYLFVCIAIAKKAGYSGWWGALFVLVPLVSGLLLILLAVLKWPVLKERDEALGVLKENDLVLPRHERAAIKDEERKRAEEDEARRRMEKAQAERQKAEDERARLSAKTQTAPAASADAKPDGKDAGASADDEAESK